MHCLAAGVGSAWEGIWEPTESVPLSATCSIGMGLILFLCGSEYIFQIAEVVEICALDCKSQVTANW